MPELKGLQGIKKKSIECIVFQRPIEIIKILNDGYAATTADSNGAMNIWKDDEGFIRCDAMRFCKSFDMKKYKRIHNAVLWAKKIKKQIK